MAHEVERKDLLSAAVRPKFWSKASPFVSAVWKGGSRAHANPRRSLLETGLPEFESRLELASVEPARNWRRWITLTIMWAAANPIPTCAFLVLVLTFVWLVR
ncbi:hypothetical protein Dda_3264 [Drechslerella dactyloides]|uniref:Uncharacterized protein n=1 Tax=Drechslerella dactyloides TaxID=74499 RepID=A0AAD6J5F4_DREDA|nr:hypothetical protein Dda_3264 [Drechslerella dactyloides]